MYILLLFNVAIAGSSVAGAVLDVKPVSCTSAAYFLWLNLSVVFCTPNLTPSVSCVGAEDVRTGRSASQQSASPILADPLKEGISKSTGCAHGASEAGAIGMALGA